MNPQQGNNPDFVLVRDSENRICGIWLRQAENARDRQTLSFLLIRCNAPKELGVAVLSGNYRVAANEYNSAGGCFVMIGSVLAPGERPTPQFTSLSAAMKAQVGQELLDVWTRNAIELQRDEMRYGLPAVICILFVPLMAFSVALGAVAKTSLIFNILGVIAGVCGTVGLVVYVAKMLYVVHAAKNGIQEISLKYSISHAAIFELLCDAAARSPFDAVKKLDFLATRLWQRPLSRAVSQSEDKIEIRTWAANLEYAKHLCDDPAFLFGALTQDGSPQARKFVNAMGAGKTLVSEVSPSPKGGFDVVLRLVLAEQRPGKATEAKLSPKEKRLQTEQTKDYYCRACKNNKNVKEHAVGPLKYFLCSQSCADTIYNRIIAQNLGRYKKVFVHGNEVSYQSKLDKHASGTDFCNWCGSALSDESTKECPECGGVQLHIRS
jgi:hypothetical protein